MKSYLAEWVVIIEILLKYVFLVSYSYADPLDEKILDTIQFFWKYLPAKQPFTLVHNIDLLSQDFPYYKFESHAALIGDTNTFLGNSSVLTRNFGVAFRVFMHAVFVSKLHLCCEKQVKRFITTKYWNKRHDKFLFISSSQQDAVKLLNDEAIVDIKYKIAILEQEEHIRIVLEPAFHKFEEFLKIENDSKWILEPGRILNGQHIKCSGAVVYPYIFPLDGKINKYGESFDGTHYRVISEASETFNFTFSSQAPGNVYGMLQDNGTWVGLVADVYYENRGFEVGYNLAHAFIWDGLFDFVATMGYANLLFLTRFPQPTSSKWTALLMPLKSSVWFGIIAAMLGIFLTFWGVIILQQRHDPKLLAPSEFRSVWKSRQFAFMYKSFVLTYGILLEQGLKIPSNKIIHFLATSWLFFVLIINTGYKSNLVSNLSSPDREVTPRNVKQLSEMTNYGITLNQIGSVEEIFFQTSELATTKRIKSRMTSTGNTFECINRAIMSKNQVCLGWNPFLYLTSISTFTVVPQLDPMITSQDGVMEVAISLGFRKDSKFLDAFNRISSSFLESGIFSKWEDDIYYYFKQKGLERMNLEKKKHFQTYSKIKQLTENQGKLPLKPLSISNLFVSFILIAFGLCAALLAFLCENLCI